MSKADELAKFEALRKEGVLTQEEFDAEKAKLLSGNETGAPLPPLAQVSPTEGPEPSVKPGVRRTKPLILASASAVVAGIAAVILIISLGGSGNSPASVATKWSSSYTNGDARTVCSALVPSQRTGCISSLKGLTVTAKSFGIGAIRTEGDRALVVTTGKRCFGGLGKGCASNADANLGFDSGHSFSNLWPEVTMLSSNNPSAETVRFWQFIVPTQKENGKWYVTYPYFVSAKTGGGSSSTTTTSPGDQDTTAESNLQMAMTGALTFYTSANQSYTGIMVGVPGVSSITQFTLGLSIVPASTASTGPNTISLRESGGEVLVITAYAPSSGICYGILDIRAPTDTPVFPEYPETTANGTYYFSNQQAGVGNCKATVTNADMLSSNGWS
jgi:hypothetical protein